MRAAFASTPAACAPQTRAAARRRSDAAPATECAANGERDGRRTTQRDLPYQFRGSIERRRGNAGEGCASEASLGFLRKSAVYCREPNRLAHL